MLNQFLLLQIKSRVAVSISAITNEDKSCSINFSNCRLSQRLLYQFLQLNIKSKVAYQFLQLQIKSRVALAKAAVADQGMGCTSNICRKTRYSSMSAVRNGSVLHVCSERSTQGLLSPRLQSEIHTRLALTMSAVRDPHKACSHHVCSERSTQGLLSPCPQ